MNLKKIKYAWKNPKIKEALETLMAYFFLGLVIFIACGTIVYILSSIDFLKPILEPIRKIGFIIFAAVAIPIIFANIIMIGVSWVVILFASIKETPNFIRDLYTSSETRRIFLGFSIGILVTFFLITLSINFFEILKIASYGNNFFLLTPEGSAAILSTMVGARTGMAIYEGNMRGGVTQKGEKTFLGWFFAILVYTMFLSLIKYFL